MSVRIRRAKPGDAQVIAGIARAAFAEVIEPSSPRVLRILAEPLTQVATVDDQIVGFVSNFLTRSLQGSWRFELDLMAVAEGAQGRGFGGTMVAESISLARQSQAESVRALVAAHNSPMQSLCRRCGFKRSSARYHLYVAAPKSNPVAAGRDYAAHLVQVETLTYKGIWLEGELSQAAIDRAQVCARRPNCSRIGTVIPQDNAAAAAILRANQFERIGEFDWWTLNLRSG